MIEVNRTRLKETARRVALLVAAGLLALTLLSIAAEQAAADPDPDDQAYENSGNVDLGKNTYVTCHEDATGTVHTLQTDDDGAGSHFVQHGDQLHGPGSECTA